MLASLAHVEQVLDDFFRNQAGATPAAAPPAAAADHRRAEHARRDRRARAGAQRRDPHRRPRARGQPGRPGRVRTPRRDLSALGFTSRQCRAAARAWTNCSTWPAAQGRRAAEAKGGLPLRTRLRRRPPTCCPHKRATPEPVGEGPADRNTAREQVTTVSTAPWRSPAADPPALGRLRDRPGTRGTWSAAAAHHAAGAGSGPPGGPENLFGLDFPTSTSAPRDRDTPQAADRGAVGAAGPPPPARSSGEPPHGAGCRRHRRSTRSCWRSSSRRPTRCSPASRPGSGNPARRHNRPPRNDHHPARLPHAQGSGRMVGLVQLGDTAWAVGRRLNRWLQLDWPVTPALLALVAGGHRCSLRGWARLEHGGSGGVDTAALVAEATPARSGRAGPARPASPRRRTPPADSRADRGNRGGSPPPRPPLPHRCRSTAWTSLLEGEIGGTPPPARTGHGDRLLPRGHGRRNRRGPDRSSSSRSTRAPITLEALEFFPAQPTKHWFQGTADEVLPAQGRRRNAGRRPPALSRQRAGRHPAHRRRRDLAYAARALLQQIGPAPGRWSRAACPCTQGTPSLDRGDRAAHTPPPAFRAPSAPRPRIASGALEHVAGTPRRHRPCARRGRADAVRRRARRPARDARRDRRRRIHAHCRRRLVARPRPLQGTTPGDSTAWRKSWPTTCGPWSRRPRNRRVRRVRGEGRPPSRSSTSRTKPHPGAGGRVHRPPETPPARPDPPTRPSSPRGGGGRAERGGSAQDDIDTLLPPSSKRLPRPSASSMPPCGAGAPNRTTRGAARGRAPAPFSQGQCAHGGRDAPRRTPARELESRLEDGLARARPAAGLAGRSRTVSTAASR